MENKNENAVKFPESPEFVKTSLAASISLGLEKGQFTGGAGCSCLNILQN